MFLLNRFAKSSYHRDHIYDVKNGVVETLYRDGFGVDCRLHSFKTMAKLCFRCEDGDYYEDEVDYYEDKDEGETCYDCGGTGIYQPSRVLKFVCFDFLVHRKKYSWHQPTRFVNFPYRITGKGNDNWKPAIKPVPDSFDYETSIHCVRHFLHRRTDKVFESLEREALGIALRNGASA